MRHKRVSGLLGLAVTLLFAPAAQGLDGFDPSLPGGADTDSSDGRRAAAPTISAQRLNGSGNVNLDGKLDELAWKDVPAARGFRQWDPDRGKDPSEQTVFKVVYDEDAVYFGIACLEKDPSKIVAKLSRRDRDSGCDIVSVYIDPYHDHTTGYNFKVSATGVQQDAYIFNDGDTDVDWDAVWQAETSRDENGWYAEIRIPFSAIKYRTEPVMTWGLQVYRYMQGRGENTAWVIWDRKEHGTVSRWGNLTGLTSVHAARQIELLPYFVQSATDPSIQGSGDDVHGFRNVGADLRYGITPDLSLNATVQPDFGQVEADPAVLNLSPFETFYDEKRPFFIEGSRFFQHPDFNLFYSRRIGTGDENSRIRYAAKLTGKSFGGVSVAALAASTDITQEGQAHNLFKNGDQLTRYFVGRFGKEFRGGRNRFNLMQTAVLRTGSRDLYGDAGSREAYTSGFDFDLNSKNRQFNMQGSFVGSIIDPETSTSDSTITGAQTYGTGGALDIRKRGGKLQGGISGRWESDKLQINDMGFLESPDEINTSVYLYKPYNPEGKSKTWNRGEFNLNANRSWIYAARTGYDINTGLPAWSYGAAHPQYSHVETSTWLQFRNYREFWMGLSYNGEGTHRYETRGGPLIREPHTYGGWAGVSSDSRKNFVLTLEGNYFVDTAKNIGNHYTGTVKWNQSSSINHSISLNFDRRIDDTQWLANVSSADYPNARGIGGVSYVFGDIHQETFDITLRSNVLFSRNQSLEIYAQPFITTGDYTRVRELIHPDSYDFLPFADPVIVNAGQPGYTVNDWDFSYAAVNLNLVYRWEYRPGSTFYLVWTQSRNTYEDRYNMGNAHFSPDIGGGQAFHNEPENRVLAKVTYWIAI